MSVMSNLWLQPKQHQKRSSYFCINKRRLRLSIAVLSTAGNNRTTWTVARNWYFLTMLLGKYLRKILAHNLAMINFRCVTNDFNCLICSELNVTNRVRNVISDHKIDRVIAAPSVEVWKIQRDSIYNGVKYKSYLTGNMLIFRALTQADI